MVRWVDNVDSGHGHKQLYRITGGTILVTVLFRRNLFWDNFPLWPVLRWLLEVVCVDVVVDLLLLQQLYTDQDNCNIKHT